MASRTSPGEGVTVSAAPNRHKASGGRGRCFSKRESPDLRGGKSSAILNVAKEVPRERG